MGYLQSAPVLVGYTVFACAVFFVEMALYFLKFGWAYRIGPVVARQKWSTTVTLEQADSALSAALAMKKKLSFSRQLHNGVICYNLRKAFWRSSFWPYITLRIESSTSGAVIHYEARPFLSMVLFLPLVLMIPSEAPMVQLAFGAIDLAVLGGYAALFLWEIPAMTGLEGVRSQLIVIGVRVCDKCGYDLRASAERCPECGKTIPSEMK